MITLYNSLISTELLRVAAIRNQAREGMGSIKARNYPLMNSVILKVFKLLVAELCAAASKNKR